MTKRRKIFLWLGLVVSLLAGGYAGMNFIFYAWLSAAAPERWPPERAALWAYSALALAILFFVFLVYCAVSLVKEANRQYREEQNAT
ncbi:MAG: hypothetical protein AMJ53_17105 [Gammaproteobacteria bacterium SG8_11]|nr:MAG: hypothetical protein AMJ53_17105 [Gammaproteobacteria bacterium SG8_11]